MHPPSRRALVLCTPPIRRAIYYLTIQDTLTGQILMKSLHNLDLILERELGNDAFEHSTNGDLVVDSNEGLVVNIGEESHDELTIHTI